MTTILGVKTEGAIILAADTQMNFYVGEERTRKKDASKIRIINNSYAIAHAGNNHTYLDAFFSHIGRDSSDMFFRYLQKRKALPQDLGWFTILQAMSKLRKRVMDVTNDKKGVKPTDIESAVISHIDELVQEKEFESSFDHLVTQMFYGLQKGSETKPLERAVKSRYLLELYLLNLGYAIKTKEDPSESGTELIIAANKPHLELYFFNHLGAGTDVENPEGVDYIAKGSGAEHVDSYIENEEFNEDKNIPDEYKPIRPSNLTPAIGIDLAIAAIKHAKTKDDDTGGIVEFAVVTETDVDEYGPRLRKAMQGAEKAVRDKAKARYRDLSKE